MNKELAQKALEKLLTRRAKLQAAYDALISEPASYGVTGSVSATNRTMTEIRAEIAAIDNKIAGLVTSTAGGMTLKVPDYHLGL